MESQHPVLQNLRRQIELLELDNKTLRHEVGRLAVDHEQDVENVRSILIDALSADQRDYVDVNVLANSIADVLGISLLKEITVSIPLTVEATMLVPAHFDISDLTLTDVGMDSDNLDVQDFSVQTWDVGDIEEI
jgi:hypothetical protein